MRKKVFILFMFLFVCLFLTSCNSNEVSETTNDNVENVEDKSQVNDSNITNIESNVTEKNNYAPKGKYNEGVVLVKYEGELSNNSLEGVNYLSKEVLYQGSNWYKIVLEDASATEDTVKFLSKLNLFDKVDYDYVMQSTDEVETTDIDISSNNYNPNPKYLNSIGAKDAWKYMNANGVQAGGLSDVIVAVIDTGVDYNHVDLRNNIWKNTAEIPDNGKDDDANGYVDDYYGWDFVGNDKDPMDDNGHGTHVAGIIAAENNDKGVVGVAYNCQVMVLKAGSSSGYFNNSDIAKAIKYAYMNGASVINMSFGGSTISVAVEDALKSAYYSCILVAAAGNDGLCNNLQCPEHQPLRQVGVSYPAALPYVIGVMSSNQRGNAVSSFSNFDHFPGDLIEYEVYAPGEEIASTWPGNKYSKLNGTSMAAPTIAGIAALLRSYYSNREMYSSKFIQSQIVNAGTALLSHKVANAYDALVNIPRPSVSFYKFYIFDNVEFSSKNNGDGGIDAGETIRIGIELMNKGGVASNVLASIDTIRHSDNNLVDPYFTIINDEISLSDIGTYSVRDSGLIYTEELVTGTEKYFEVVVSEDCPNDYLCDFNVNISCSNGLDSEDTESYVSVGDFYLTVTNGIVLDYSYTEDTVFPGNKRYIISHDVTVASGVTLTFEAGAVIQFYENNQGYFDTMIRAPRLINYGHVIFDGTSTNRIRISPSELFANSDCTFETYGWYTYKYCDIYRLRQGNGYNCRHTLEHCVLYSAASMTIDTITDSIIYGGYSSSSTPFYASVSKRNLWYLTSNGTSSVYSNREDDIVFVDNSNGGIGSINLGYGGSKNSVFMQSHNSNELKYYPMIGAGLSTGSKHEGNKFYGMYLTHPEQTVSGYYNSQGLPIIDMTDTTNQDLSKVWPYITDIRMEDKEGNEIKTCGTGEVKFIVSFNRDMDTTKQIELFFGTKIPYSDYRIFGQWSNPREWVGEFTLKSAIENGLQRFSISNAWTADEEPIECLNNGSMYSFNIDTTSAQAMLMQAVAEEGRIKLSFMQDDYDTLLGYNIYRSTEENGEFVRINPTIIPPANDNSWIEYIDDNAEPGVKYYYTFTVVLTDFSESSPAGKVTCTALDTIAPQIYHTPINQGYANNNLVISCISTDNVAIPSVTLYYRTKGETSWKTLTMNKDNDTYRVTVFGNEVTLAGIEYYIVASDGYGSIEKGSADAPYSVIVKDSSVLSKLGDVDGDGIINTKDALMMMQFLEGKLIWTDDQFKRADLNKDNVISSVEALRILQYINGRVTNLEM